MNLFFLFNKNSEASLELFLKNNPDSTGALKVITFSSDIGIILGKKYNLKWKCLDDYLPENEEEKINREAILWLHQKSQEDMGQNVSLVKYFLYDNVSLWWISGYLYLYNDIINTIFMIELLSNVLIHEKPDLVLLPDVLLRRPTKSQIPMNDPNFAYKILGKICKKKGINTERIKNIRKSVFSWNKLILTDRLQVLLFSFILTRYYQLLRRLLAFRTYKFQLRKRIPLVNHKKIVAISPSRNWGKIFDLRNSNQIKGDSKFGYFFQKIADISYDKVLSIDANSVVSGELKILNQKLIGDKYTKWTSLEYFTDPKTRFKANSLKRVFRRKAKQLLKKVEFQNLFEFKGIPFYEIIESRLSFVLPVLLPEGVIKRVFYEKLCQLCQPDILIITYETGLHGRAAISAAHKMDIPTLAIQHGKIHGSHPQYIHIGVSTRDNLDVRFAPIADITAVFGHFSKEVLTRFSSYPAKNIEITGQISSDLLPYSHSIYNKNLFLERLSLVKTYPLICLMAQNFEKESDYIRFYQISCESLNNFPEINFIVKLHPTQNTEKVRRLIERYYLWPEKIKYLQKEDLYEIIYCGDIFITGNSTVGLEVIMFKKPLITIEGFKYSMGYAESGASFGINSKQEMIEALEVILAKSQRLDQVLNKSEAYVKQHLFKVDGKASQRVLEIADRLILQT